MKELTALLSQLEQRFEHYNCSNTSISNASVGWHLEHSLIVLSQIAKAVETSEPKKYRWTLNFARIFVFSLNKIPRGRGKAPKFTQPREETTLEILKTRLATAKERMEVLTKLTPHHHFKHPFFGVLNLKFAIKFMILHTEHHLQITDDILKSKNKVI